MARLQHIALRTNDLGRTRAFYKDVLGLEEANFDPDGGRLWLSLEDGFTLIFDRSDEVPSASSITYLGLELADFAAVDEMYGRLGARASMGRDMRELYRHEQGPYGFFVEDPNGYVIKVFKYNYLTQKLQEVT